MMQAVAVATRLPTYGLTRISIPSRAESRTQRPQEDGVRAGTALHGRMPHRKGWMADPKPEIRTQAGSASPRSRWPAALSPHLATDACGSGGSAGR